jgi:FtsX-like permease family
MGEAAREPVNPLRPLIGAFGALLLAAVIATPFVLNSYGPWAYRAPAKFIKTKTKPVKRKRRLEDRSEPVDIPALAARLQADVRKLVETGGAGSITGRHAGSPEAAAVAELIAERFRKAGLKPVAKQKFQMVAPAVREDKGKDKGKRRMKFSVEGTAYKLYPLAPNLVRTCTISTPGNVLKTHLVWGGNGRLGKLRGKELNGAILVLEEDQGYDWLVACSLGAKAVIFIEPETPRNLRPALKVLGTALDIPRFWIGREDGIKLKQRLLQVDAENRATRAAAGKVAVGRAAASKDRRLQAELTCRVDWKSSDAFNVYGLLPGAHPEKREDITAIIAYYDANSMVPELAPGAEAAGSMAAMFELIERFKAKPPERTVLFVAIGAHHQGMAGEKQAAELLRRSVTTMLKEVGGGEHQDGKILGTDARAVLQAAGQGVSGMTAGQRVFLYLVGFFLLLLAGLVSYYRKLKSRSIITLYACTIIIGGLSIYLAGSYLGRERKSKSKSKARVAAGDSEKKSEKQLAKEKKEREDRFWRDSDYGNIRRTLKVLEEFEAGLKNSSNAKDLLSKRMDVIMLRRILAEREAIEARGRLDRLLKGHKDGQSFSAKQRTEYGPLARDFYTKVLRATDADPEICELTVELLKRLNWKPEKGTIAEISSDLEELRESLKAALRETRKNNAPLFKMINECADQVEEMDERLKVQGPARLKYVRLAGYLDFLVALGPDVPERVKSCVGIDLSSHSDRMAVFFKGKHVNHFIQNDEKKVQSAVSLVAEYLAQTGSAKALAQGWAQRDRLPFVLDTTETISGQDWKGVAPGTPYFSAEVFSLAGLPSLTLGTASDARRTVNTPFDVPERMDFTKLAKQTEILCRTLVSLLHSGSAEVGQYEVPNWGQLGLALGTGATGGAKHLREKLSADAQGVLDTAGKTKAIPSAADQAKVRSELNALLADPDFYSKEKLPKVSLEGEALTLFEQKSDQGKLSDSDQRRFNRLVLETILPQQLSKLATRERGLTTLERTESECDYQRGSMCLRIYGQVIEYNPAKSKTLSVTPVPGAVVFHRREPQTQRNTVRPYGAPVSPDTLFMTDRFGAYEFPGLSSSTQREWFDKANHVLAYGVIEKTGNVVQAPDQGAEGKKYGEPWRTPKRNEDEYTVVTFGCQALNIFEAVDMRSYESRNTQFTKMSVYKGIVDEVPISFGWSNTHETGGLSYPEHALVVFTDRRGEDRKTGRPPLPVQLKVTFGRRLLAGTKWPTLGVTPGELNKKNFTGQGISVRRSARVLDPDSQKRDDKGKVDPDSGDPMPLAVVMAQDLYRLDDYRLGVLEVAGVRNQALVSQHESARADLKAALAAKDAMLWDEMLVKARSAWCYEARGYPNIQNTVTDVVKGLLFYLFLMLPFAYFMERLIFAFPDVNRQLAGVFGMFMVSFAVLYLVHPAFGITSAAPMILLAFITLALSLLVMVMISSRFRREIEALQHRPGASHKAEVDRFNAAISAFLLGINNMRRRKVRTILTTTTLVLLTFSVLSFSSIESTLGANKREIETTGKPAYRGILVRNESWGLLDEFAARSLRDEYEASCMVSPRCWAKGKQLQHADVPSTVYKIPGMLGVRSIEREITGVGSDDMILAGRWFSEEEAAAGLAICLLDEELMALLELDIKKVKVVSDLTKPENRASLPHVSVGGERLAVIGVLKTEAYQKVVDIDGERVVPVDWEVESWTRHRGKGAGSEELEFRKYQHVDAFKVPVVPYAWLMNRGGGLYSVAIKPNDPKQVNEIAENQLLRRISVPMFVSDDVDEAEDTEDIKTMFMSTAQSSNVSGVGSLIVPMLIAALIVLNTMLGSVYERESEISIFGSLGLAPVHIGSLFIAESAVYAVVSAVGGYILGQSVSKLVVSLAASGLMTGFSLNYSSLSAVFSACFIIIVVMASAAYPAMRAGQLSVPDVERIWKFPEPDGDRLVFLFPFTVSGEQALGINMHLRDFFADHANQSVGEFYTADTTLNYRQPGVERGGYRLNSNVWIAPFDFGISQKLELSTFLAEDETDIFETSMVLTRLSGSVDAWVKMNHRFMKSIRKQFLLWRMFTNEERAWYVARARVELGEISADEVPDHVAEAGTDRGAEAAPEVG